MSTDRTIDYVELPASDLDAQEEFYSKTFGWKFTDYGPEYRSFHDGKLSGGFYRSDEKSTTAAGGALIVLFGADLEATLERVTAHGGTIAKKIFPFPGGRRFHFFDPAGNELAVWSDK